MSDDRILVLCKQDFYKIGKGENAKGFKGDVIAISPALAEFLAEKNIVEVLYDVLEIIIDDEEKEE